MGMVVALAFVFLGAFRPSRKTVSHQHTRICLHNRPLAPLFFIEALVCVAMRCICSFLFICKNPISSAGHIHGPGTLRMDGSWWAMTLCLDGMGWDGRMNGMTGEMDYSMD